MNEMREIIVNLERINNKLIKFLENCKCFQNRNNKQKQKIYLEIEKLKKLKQNTGLFTESSLQTTNELNSNIETAFRCDWPGCGKQFRTNKVVLNHVKTCHSKTTPKRRLYECCSRVFKRKDQFDRHVCTQHTKHKPLKCDWPGCEFETLYSNKLKSHWMRHTGDKPFACSWPSCDCTFRQQHHLSVHTLKHTGEKPFICVWPGCDRRFQSRQALTIHSRKTHKN